MRLIVLLRSDICCFLARIFHLCSLCVSLDLTCLQHVTHPYLQCLNHARSRKKNAFGPFCLLAHSSLRPSKLISSSFVLLSLYVYLTYHRHSCYPPTSGSWISLQYHKVNNTLIVYSLLPYLPPCTNRLGCFILCQCFNLGRLLSVCHMFFYISSHEYTSDVHVTFELDDLTLGVLGRLLVKRHHRGS
jgi:hypothetical protein